LDLKQKAQKVSEILEETFGIPERRQVNPLDCLIKTILSQNTNDVNRDRAFENLKARFPTWEDALKADAGEIEKAIRVGGLSNQKSANIKNLLASLKSERGELSVDFIKDMDNDEAVKLLCKHRGIGIKTTYVTLAFAFGREVFPVDTHILRISKRLGFIPAKTTLDKAHELMASLIPEGKAFSFHLNLITFGREICQARKPKCDVCPIVEYCLYVREE